VQFVVGLVGRPLLVVGVPRLAADPKFRPSESADQAVTRAIDEDRRVESDEDFGAHRPAAHGRDPGVVELSQLHLPDVGVQVQGHVGLCPDQVEHRLIPVVGVSFGVAKLILEEQLAHDPGLAGEALPAVGGGADDPDPDFAGGVAAEHGAIADERYP
jgi:hypothetical protein